MQGAGKAAMTLAAFALELDRMGDALRWLTRAMHELGEEYESVVEGNMDFVIAHVKDDYQQVFPFSEHQNFFLRMQQFARHALRTLFALY